MDWSGPFGRRASKKNRWKLNGLTLMGKLLDASSKSSRKLFSVRIYIASQLFIYFEWKTSIYRSFFRVCECVNAYVPDRIWIFGFCSLPELPTPIVIMSPSPMMTKSLMQRSICMLCVHLIVYAVMLCSRILRACRQPNEWMNTTSTFLPLVLFIYFCMAIELWHRTAFRLWTHRRRRRRIYWVNHFVRFFFLWQEFGK